MRRRTSGVAAPAATGTSARLAISIRRSALGKVSESGTLPQTGVMASTFSSGERRARKMAMASSTPGSVSRMMRTGLDGAALVNVTVLLGAGKRDENLSVAEAAKLGREVASTAPAE